MKIILTDREYKFIEMLSIGRHFLKDIVIPDRDMERWCNTQKEADMIGVMGEYAAAKYLNIPFDTTINLEGDGGQFDMFLGDWPIQVKSTKYPTGRLVFNNMEEITALIYILAVCNIENKSVDIIGYASHNDLTKNLYIKDLGHGTRYCIDQDKLKDISWLTFYYQQHKNKL